MNNNLTELVFILDRSGSMAGLEGDTIGGFNSLINKQKKEDGEACVSVILFDDYSDVVYDRVNIDKIEPMTDKQYYVRGCTALLDALGGAIDHVKNVHKYAREEDRPGKTIFVITTDGLENASSKYTVQEVKTLVSKMQEKFKWEFLFLGANMDAVEVAGRMGIRKERAATYECDHVGTAVNFNALDRVIKSARTCKAPEDMAMAMDDCDWKEEIAEYKASASKAKSDSRMKNIK